MPTNVSFEYVSAQRKYLLAKNREERIQALEEMVRFAPSHKGGENLRKELRTRLAKLKTQKEAKRGGRSYSLKKEGDAQVCILGLTQSGKSTLLSDLTNAKPKISSHPFTTTKPVIGTMDYKGVRIQIIEIPSTFDPRYTSVASSSDGIIIMANSDEERKRMLEIVERFKLSSKSLMFVKKDNDIEVIKTKIWRLLGLIRVYTKEPGRNAAEKPLVLKSGATVLDAAKEVHKDFVKFFKFGRVWGRSVRFPGEKVGKEHSLVDGDILEIHA